MMLYQFKLLESVEQLELIEKCGVYLAERIDGDYTYKLLQLETFYVEEEWHTKFNERRKFISFISEEKLEPYLQNIDLSSLHLPTKKNR